MDTFAGPNECECSVFQVFEYQVLGILLQPPLHLLAKKESRKEFGKCWSKEDFP